MIRAGIIGGSNPMAGELIRVLINHPDVEIMWVDSARFAGRLVADIHHGLLGETELRITPTGARLDDINVLFIFRHKGQTVEWLEQHVLPEGLRVVDLSVDMREPQTAAEWGFVYGMPELNRKAMVRGATRAIVPHPVANLALLALMPLAKEQALRERIDISVDMPEQGEQLDDPVDTAWEIVRALQVLQPDCDPSVTLVAAPSADDRVMTARIELDCDLNIGEIQRAYEEFYDDHNFTFVVEGMPEAKEVAGTNKCLIHIDKHDGRATITAMMDALLKGAAGTAVHDMNLLFGLHERVGLALKASTF